MAILHQNYLVYGDGSCIGNPGPGGWGVIVRDPAGVEREFNGHDPRTTNNRMELTAAIEGLRATPPESHVVFKSDSQYVVKTVNDGWKRNANQDLWRKLDEEIVERTVRFEWVRGHDTDPINNRADRLALMGAHGQLVDEAVSPEKDATPEKAPARRAPRGRGSAGASQDLAQLTPLLEDGESIRECASCGAKFVSAREGDKYCSQARCQLKARNR